MHPTLNMSTLLLYLVSPKSNSGLLYHNVTTLLVKLPEFLFTFLLKPKSPILHSPSKFKKIFEAKNFKFKKKVIYT